MSRKRQQMQQRQIMHTTENGSITLSKSDLRALQYSWEQNGIQQFGLVMEVYLAPIQDALGQVSAVMSIMRGAALVGSGELLRETIHQLSGELVRWLELTKQRIEYAAHELERPDILTGFDVAPAEHMLKAADRFYATGDTTALDSMRVVPGDTNPILYNVAALRSALMRGRERKDVLESLYLVALPFYQARGDGQWKLIRADVWGLLNSRESLNSDERGVLTEWTINMKTDKQQRDQIKHVFKNGTIPTLADGI